MARTYFNEANTLEHISPADGENIHAKRVGVYGYDYTTGTWRRQGLRADGSIAESNYQQRMEYDGNRLIYLGVSTPGTLENEEKWIIKKLTYSGENLVAINFANNSPNESFSWSNRASYTYG